MLHRDFFAALALALLTATGAAAQNTAVHVVNYLDIAPRQATKANGVLRQYAAASAKAAGSQGVELFAEIGRPGRIVVRETWADQKAFEAHGKSATASAMEAALKPLQIAPPDQRVHLAFAAGNGPAKAGHTAVHVFTHVDVPPPRQAELEPLLRSLQAASAKIPTAVRFDVLQQTNRKNHFTVVETWVGQSALDRAAAGPAQREFRDKLGPMLGALYDHRIYRQIR